MLIIVNDQDFIFTGGGFFVEENDVWFLNGVVSASFKSKNNLCDVSKYTLFTKINEFVNWIKVKNKDHDVFFKCSIQL